MSKPKDMFALDPPFFDLVYGGKNLRHLQSFVDVSGPSFSRQQIVEQSELLRKVELLFSSWGAPRLGRTFLEAAPGLRAVFHAAGTVIPWVTDAFWDRKVPLPNVVLTPHIAGSLHDECRRLARFVAEETDRFLSGDNLRWKVIRSQIAAVA